MNLGRNMVPSFFRRALPLWLIVIALSLSGGRRCHSQTIDRLPGRAFLSATDEPQELSPSEVVKRYWQASAEGRFSETRKYIDPRLFDSKHRGEEDIKDIIKTLTSRVPHLIYDNPVLPDHKPGELVIGAIDEESVSGDTALVATITNFRGRPIAISRFRLIRRNGKWKIQWVKLDDGSVDNVLPEHRKRLMI